MAQMVGPHGQVVIDEDILDGLGVQAGWLAVQRRVGNHVEIHFSPPDHNHSLAGILASSIERRVPTDMDMRRVIHEAWDCHLQEDPS